MPSPLVLLLPFNGNKSVIESKIQETLVTHPYFCSYGVLLFPAKGSVHFLLLIFFLCLLFINIEVMA